MEEGTYKKRLRFKKKGGGGTKVEQGSKWSRKECSIEKRESEISQGCKDKIKQKMGNRRGKSERGEGVLNKQSFNKAIK